MNTLSILKDTLYKLKKREIISLLTYLKSYRKESNEQAMKSINLIMLLLKKRDYSSDQIQKILYGKNNYHAFNKLLNRLKDKLYEVLIFDNNLLQPEVYGKRNQVAFEIKKKLLQCEILHSRGINSELEKFHSNIIYKAKKFELYDTLIETLNAKQRFVGFRYGSEAIEKLNSEINYFENCRKINKNASNLFNNIASKINFSYSSSEFHSDLIVAIKDLKKYYAETKSPVIFYYFIMLQTEYYQNKSDFQSAQKLLIELKAHLENNPSAFTKNRMGGILMNIAINELLMFDFATSLRNVNYTLNIYSDVLVNYHFALELKFYAYFYTNKMDKAENIIEELFHGSRFSKTPFHNSKRAYLLACMKTFKGKYDESNEMLKEAKGIEKDKEGWGIGIRLLSIMNSIEKENYEKADRDIVKLAKHTSGIATKKTIRKRNLIITEILCKLMDSGYEYNKTYKNQLRNFRMLESNQAECRWKIKSPELIIFHEWFKSKADGRPYNHIASIQHEKEKYLQSVKNMASA